MNKGISKLKNLWPFASLLVISLVFHFAFLDYPGHLVFDELHFVNYAKYYLSGQYYFDIHPPLGKLMLAGAAYLGGPANSLAVFRFLPALFGSFLVLVFSWLAYLLTKSKNTALLAGTLILMDNALLVESRFALMDTFLIFFGVLTLCFFLLFLKENASVKKRYVFLLLAAACFGLAISIKWTGFATIGVMSAAALAQKKKISETLIPLAAAAGLGLFIYAIPFAAHFKLLTNYGPADFPMEQFSYGTGEIENSNGFFEKFTKLNAQMLTANLGAKNPEIFSSKWFEWPFGKKPLRITADIYLAGNPVLWLVTAGFVIVTSLKILLKQKLPFDKSLALALIGGYFLNLLPFIFIKRTAYIYHYFPALLFAVLLASCWLIKLWPTKKPALIAVMASIAGGFLFMLPYSY